MARRKTTIVHQNGQMATETFEFDIETFQGEALNPPIHVTGSADLFDSPDTAKQSGDWPNDKTILEWLNSDRLAKAKSNARAKQLADKMEEYQKSPAYKTAQAVKALIALGYSKSDAETLAQLQK